MEDRRCTVLLVHCHYRLPGGEDAVFAAERRLLEAHGHRVIVYERNNETPGLAAKLLLPFRAVFSLKTCRDLRALLRRERVDIVHVHNTLFAVSPAVFWAARRAGVPAVQTLHNFRLFCPSGVLLRGGQVCEDCPLRRGGLLNAVRHACYRGSRAQSAVCAFVYAFHRLLGTYRQRLCQLACQALDDCGGDLFAAFVQIYGHMEQAAAEKRSCAEDSTRLLAMFRLNAPLSPNLLFQAIQPEELLTQLIPHMDLRLLSLTADSDLSDVLHILTGITVSSLAAGAASDAGPEPARQHYLHTVQLLKRGMAAPQPISH